MSRQLFTVLILNVLMVVLVPFGVWGGMWNSTVSAPDHCLLVPGGYSDFCLLQGLGRNPDFKPKKIPTNFGIHKKVPANFIIKKKKKKKKKKKNKL